MENLPKGKHTKSNPFYRQRVFLALNANLVQNTLNITRRYVTNIKF